MMNVKHFFFRCYHWVFKVSVIVLPFPRPKLFVGNDGVRQWLEELTEKRVSRILVVSDEVITELGLIDDLLNRLNNHRISVTVYTDVKANPSISNVERGFELYREQACQGILAIGGGSVMDCAKLIGARSAKPAQPLKKMKGLFKILRPTPYLAAIPTTAGTGSETTIAAVVTDPDKKQKYAISDFFLMPNSAILLPQMTQGLPDFITAATGMDALTHAIEAYISKNANAFTRKKSLASCKLIFSHLQWACKEGDNLNHRQAMLEASFFAGEAFTRAFVGYVHAIAHQLGALYNTPHGLANAVILPKILRWYGEAIYPCLSEISDYCELLSLEKTDEEKALHVMDIIEKLNHAIGIPTYLHDLKVEDVNVIADRALKEAHPDYPVPVFMNASSCVQLLETLIKKTD